MTTKTLTCHTGSGLLTKLPLWMRALDEAVHHDPVPAAHHRIEALEARIRKLEAGTLAGKVLSE